jgi:hypothetical protein
MKSKKNKVTKEVKVREIGECSQSGPHYSSVVLNYAKKKKRKKKM